MSKTQTRHPQQPSHKGPLSHRPQHNSIYRFPVRGCCACRTWARLGDWNPVPPGTDELCYVCEHTACPSCKDRWASSDENLRATENFRQKRSDERSKEPNQREVTPWVLDAISKHSQMWRDDHERGEGGFD